MKHKCTIKELLDTYPKIHGNTKVCNPITGRKNRTVSKWRQAGRDDANHLMTTLQKDLSYIR